MMENDRPLVEILLATYNGEKYLSELIDSLLEQSYRNILITISDDSSTDGTIGIIRKYKDEYPGLFRILPHTDRFGNAKDNFFFLLRNSVADYVFLCDQDDVWLPEKVEIMMDELQKHDNEPALVHSDLKVVDASLNTITESFVRFSNYNPEHEDFYSLIFMNTVTGCACAVNRKLINMLNMTSISEYGNIIMHDRWLALIAAAFGAIKFSNVPLILYRQHDTNSVGAVRYSFIGVKGLRKIVRIISRKKEQTNAFIRSYSNYLDTDIKQFLLWFFRRRSGVMFYIKNRTKIHGLKRKIGFLLCG